MVSQAASNPRLFTGFRCPEPLLEALKGRAEADGRSLSTLIVYILANEVKGTRPRKKPHG
jgi:hypothetical protein